jgi:hypothetical protein
MAVTILAGRETFDERILCTPTFGFRQYEV